MVRSNVPQKSHYSEYCDELRLDFWFACAYCTIGEIEGLGIGFETDHYVPRSRQPALTHIYKNLMYSCIPCNRTKGKKPTDRELEAGFRFFRADEDHPDNHFDLRGFRLTPRDRVVGEYTIETLYLNKLLLRRLREIRQRLYTSSEGIKNGIRSLLKRSIDDFPPDVRARVLDLRADMQKQVGEVDAGLDKVLQNYNRSPLLQADPEKAQHAARRREWLKKVGCLTPEPEQRGRH
ncbi:MAG TPA: HNH endonuclease [Candidatus Binatia bacterium]